MTELKSHEFDSSIARISKSFRIFVFYGPDRGLVSERASEIAASIGIPLNDPFAVVRLDGSDLQGDAGRLVDETRSLGLFGGDRLVWVKASGSEKALTDGLEIVAEGRLEGCHLIVEAGDVKKGAALRKIGQSSSNIAMVPCYADDNRAISALIDAELSKTRQHITPAAREYLLSLLGGDRLASRNELSKLLLYCKGADQIDLEQVSDIIGDASVVSVDEAVDAVLKGDREGFLHAAKKVVASKTPVFMMLQACLKQFQQLDAMRSEMEDKRLQLGQILQTAGRGIHFRRKPLVERALRGWSSSDLSRETARLQSAILQTRQKNALEANIAIYTLLSTTLQSARRLR
ncbi:DNA polymerase III subunit delta [Ciceribacter sp. L1K23]|uniref:DNA polymerase III subunit delta n=1 Tax=Ciceribacter sp. L1K23 TaxID=2820276 RepID=UPI001B81613D|nr:DNA polymerase III subunit delta [Ciceribacter sp. L1K23]MBR0557660.1 DNA polymerase III subunit delta [Ciceribacter sp. L1K23]